MLPEEHLWPIDSCGTTTPAAERSGTFTYSPRPSTRVTARPSRRRIRRKAQVMAYEGQRAMFEAFGRNKYTAPA